MATDAMAPLRSEAIDLAAHIKAAEESLAPMRERLTRLTRAIAAYDGKPTGKSKRPLNWRLIVSEHPGKTGREYAELLGIQPSSRASSPLAGLVHRGKIRRERSADGWFRYYPVQP